MSRARCPFCRRVFSSPQGLAVHHARRPCLAPASLTPRAAWQAMLLADAALRAATASEYEAAEKCAQEARKQFADALKRANRVSFV